jgi:hypothetical protein
LASRLLAVHGADILVGHQILHDVGLSDACSVAVEQFKGPTGTRGKRLAAASQCNSPCFPHTLFVPADLVQAESIAEEVNRDDALTPHMTRSRRARRTALRPRVFINIALHKRVTKRSLSAHPG